MRPIDIHANRATCWLRRPRSIRADSAAGKGRTVCRLCDTSKYVERVAVPYVFKYLVSELAAMNISIKCHI